MPAMDEAVTDGHDVPPFALAYTLRQTMAGMPQQQLIWLDGTDLGCACLTHLQVDTDFTDLFAFAVTVRDILARYDVGETVGVGGAL